MSLSDSEPLADRVKEVLAAWGHDHGHGFFSDEVREAMRLAELFEDIEPQIYALPLETMAGGVLPAWARGSK